MAILGMKRQTVIIYDDVQRVPFVRFLSNLPLEKPIKVTVEDHKKKRSLNQNSLYFMWVNEVAEKVSEYSGHAVDEIHEFFKHKFLTPRIIEINGQTIQLYTTTKLTTAEMSEYLNHIHAFVTGELGIYLTLPEERYTR